MPRKVKATPKEVAKLIGEGLAVEEIRNKLGLKTVAQVKGLYLEALVAEGKIPEIKTKKAVGRRLEEKRIGKRGSISLSSKLVIDHLGFKKGDAFVVSREGDDILLKKK
ncbi:MAG: hypothetical protein HY998_05460 [candidate division NC10 bacterium]|nr:hypothetical protein [candidate division NC10 bacterium]